MNLIILFKEDFIDDNIVRLKGRRLKHVLKVHRAEVGDELRVGILNGDIGKGKILNLNKEALEMEISLYEKPPKPSNVKLVLAMPRPKVFKRILQDVTTMGVKDIYLIKTWRVDKSYFGSSYLEEDKLFEHMILGLEQARDTILPNIHIKNLFKPFVEDEIPEILKGGRGIVAHPIADSECPRGTDENITLAIGPEGGFIPYEIEMLKNNGFEVVGLGDRILRVETAVPYILGRLS